MIELMFASKWTENLIVATYCIIFMKKQFPKFIHLIDLELQDYYCGYLSCEVFFKQIETWQKLHIST